MPVYRYAFVNRKTFYIFSLRFVIFWMSVYLPMRIAWEWKLTEMRKSKVSVSACATGGLNVWKQHRSHQIIVDWLSQYSRTFDITSSRLFSFRVSYSFEKSHHLPRDSLNHWRVEKRNFISWHYRFVFSLLWNDFFSVDSLRALKIWWQN